MEDVVHFVSQVQNIIGKISNGTFFQNKAIQIISFSYWSSIQNIFNGL